MPVTVRAGHQAPGSEGLVQPPNLHSEAVFFVYGLHSPGMGKVGGPALTREARSNLPQLARVGPTEKHPVLAVSLQQFR